MVTELKTLKDIKSVGTVMGIANYYADIREEAIKHIKSKIKSIEGHSHKKFDWGYEYLDCIQCRNYFVQIQWIRYFFNITEEELK